MFIIATVVKMKSFNHILNFAALVKLAKDNNKSVEQQKGGKTECRG